MNCSEVTARTALARRTNSCHPQHEQDRQYQQQQKGWGRQQRSDVQNTREYENNHRSSSRTVHENGNPTMIAFISISNTIITTTTTPNAISTTAMAKQTTYGRNRVTNMNNKGVTRENTRKHDTNHNHCQEQ
eukprot:scaffold39431_cov29-Prasinocladus_malaysianus.AAC.2